MQERTKRGLGRTFAADLSVGHTFDEVRVMPFVAIRQRMADTAAMLIFVTLCGAMACQGGGIRGRVRDDEARPISGATITWADGDETSSTTTGGDGAFLVRLERVGPVSQGRFTVSAGGYKTATESIGDGPYECTVTLQPVQASDDSFMSCRNME